MKAELAGRGEPVDRICSLRGQWSSINGSWTLTINMLMLWALAPMIVPINPKTEEAMKNLHGVSSVFKLVRS